MVARGVQVVAPAGTVGEAVRADADAMAVLQVLAAVPGQPIEETPVACILIDPAAGDAAATSCFGFLASQQQT